MVENGIIYEKKKIWYLSVNPKSASTFVNIISSSDTCFTVTWAIM